MSRKSSSNPMKRISLEANDNNGNRKLAKVDEPKLKLFSPLTLKPKELYLKDVKDKTRDVGEFEKINRIGEGTYGIVYRARDSRTGGIVAVKKVRMENEHGGLPISSCREISLLSFCHHENIVNLVAIATDRPLDSIFLVMEYCEHDLSCLLDNMPNSFREADVKCLSIQLIKGVQYMHDRHILHRDLKVSNILLTNNGVLKIADFGLARRVSDPPVAMTQNVVTLWYRAPELLLGSDVYTTAIDMWSCGCIIAELLQHEPLMAATSEPKQVELLVNLLGTPSDKIWPEFSSLPHSAKINWPNQPYNNIRSKFKWIGASGCDLLIGCLIYNPRQRLSAREVLKHRYFQETPFPTAVSLLPTFPEHRNRVISQQRRNNNHNIRNRDNAFGDMFG